MAQGLFGRSAAKGARLDFCSIRWSLQGSWDKRLLRFENTLGAKDALAKEY